MSFQAIYKFLTPSWLHTGEGESLLESLTALFDAAAQRVRSGLEARFPTRGGEDALALIGADRLIVRGRGESSEQYAQRLIRWRYPRGHRVRGNTFAFLEQYSDYFGGLRMWYIDARGNRREHAYDGTESYSRGNAWNWDGVDPIATGRWARYWIVITPVPDHAVSRWGTFASGDVWGGLPATMAEIAARDVTVGQRGISGADGRVMRGMLRGKHPWKPAGTRAEYAILVYDDYTSAPDPVPDGTWDTWAGRPSTYGYANLKPNS